MIALPGFEPELSAPKADVVDRYTTGLYWQGRHKEGRKDEIHAPCPFPDRPSCQMIISNLLL